MKLQVHYMSQLRATVGLCEEEVELPEGSSLAELLMHLAEHRGGVKAHVVSHDGHIHPSLLVVVNGSAVPSGEAAATVLRWGDVIILLPPIAGG